MPNQVQMTKVQITTTIVIPAKAGIHIAWVIP